MTEHIVTAPTELPQAGRNEKADLSVEIVPRTVRSAAIEATDARFNRNLAFTMHEPEQPLWEKTMGTLRLVFLLALLAPSQQARADDSSDGWITTKTKLSLLAEENIAANSVHVDTLNAVVTLHGKVKTDEARANAEEPARETPGSRSISTNVKVKDERAESGSASDDQKLTQQVRMALLTNKTLPSTKISVDSRRGEITLFGQVPSQQARQQAETVAAGVEGVRSVRNELEVLDRKSTVNSRQNDSNRRSNGSTSRVSTDAGNRFDDSDAGSGPPRPTTTRTTGSL